MTFEPRVSKVDSSIFDFVRQLLQIRIQVKTRNKNKIKKKTQKTANGEDPDETEPSYLELHCLHRYLHWSAGLKALKGNA